MIFKHLTKIHQWGKYASSQHVRKDYLLVTLVLLTQVLTLTTASARGAVAPVRLFDPLQADGSSYEPSVSGDGRYVAFASEAANLVKQPYSSGMQIFVRDVFSDRTELISVSSSGKSGLGDSYLPAISGDGRYVAFYSLADNLVPDDTNNLPDFFVRDRFLRMTERVSVNSAGEQGYGSDYSWSPSISADGRYVAFVSGFVNLVEGDTNGAQDVFVRDREKGTTERVSVSSSGAEAQKFGDGAYSAAISSDGRFVAFVSSAADLVEGDTNGWPDTFVRDRQEGITERVSVSTTGGEASTYSWEPSISADGRYVVFYTTASLEPEDQNGWEDVYLRDRALGTTERVALSYSGEAAKGINYSYPSSLSGDGRYVVFGSSASNLVTGDTNGSWDFFVRDRVDQTTERISITSAGMETHTAQNTGTGSASISADGRYAVFASSAFDLVPGDTNGLFDVFLRDRTAHTTVRVSVPDWLVSLDQSVYIPAVMR